LSFDQLLCSKEIANFHRPKAKWYPHENKLTARFQGDECSHGPMTAIVMTLGGKGVKFLVNAEETPLSVKSKASKKLGASWSHCSLLSFNVNILAILIFTCRSVACQYRWAI
jgi:hypothetical protein